jgi:hypothetical protein
MVRDWFRGAKALTVNELILRKDYEKAIELISAEREQNRRNERLRLQLGHLLTLGLEAAPGPRETDTMTRNSGNGRRQPWR